MVRNGSFAILLLAVVGASPAAAESPAAREVVEAARSECTKEKGQFDASPGSITPIDLSGDGTPDEIVDATKFACSTAVSLYCGTGGCPITAIVDGKSIELFGRGWMAMDWAGSKILLLDVHGSRCGANGTTRCFEAITWSEGAFRSVAPAN
jgi:hypothetical protein